MATPSEKLAESLVVLRTLQEAGVVAIRSSDLSRTHRERLLKNGFLQEAMKGWYLSARPDEQEGQSTTWYASYWDFCAAYLKERFGRDWSLSPEQSLLLHAGNWTVPAQLLVRAPKGGNKPTQLLYGTSIFDVRAALPKTGQRDELRGLRAFSLPATLVQVGPGMFRNNATDVRAALAMIQDASDVLSVLLAGGHSVVAGRLAGAFRNIGRDKLANEIVESMKMAGYKVDETDPFEGQSLLTFGNRERSPYVSRVRLMWQHMRGEIADLFPTPKARVIDIDAYIKQVEDTYVMDAYHSLSIEGYRVSADLIERVRDGRWDPDSDAQDREQRNALAARGYFEAFQAVKESVSRVLNGANAGEVADQDHGIWYRNLFAPGVSAGIIAPEDLAGYRNGPVFISRSMHVPPPREAIRDLMPVFFELLTQENDPAVRFILGHFVFVFIHPYIDGNGRMGRFLMNVMMAAGGFPWTVITVENRNEYMAALEEASVNQNIRPFAEFLANFLSESRAV